MTLTFFWGWGGEEGGRGVRKHFEQLKPIRKKKRVKKKMCFEKTENLDLMIFAGPFQFKVFYDSVI